MANLIPSEFFTTKYTFSNGSKNVYEAANQFSTKVEDNTKQSVDKDLNLAESKCTSIANDLFLFCCEDLELSKILISLTKNQNVVINANINKIWEKVMTLAETKQGESLLQESELANHIEKLTSKSKLSPLPTDLKINPDINAVILNGLTNNDPNAYDKTLELFETHSPAEMLTAIKYVDHVLIDNQQQKTMQRSSYELRTLCAAKSKGTISTAEAYTYSLDASLYKDYKRLALYLQNEAHYIPERQRAHYMVLISSELQMMNMSRRFNDQTPTIYAVRGNTASGKSHACKNDDLFKRGLLNGEAIGALNPDTVKADLRRGVPGITNEQIHDEGRAVAEKMTSELKKKAIKSSLVLDERLGEKAKITDLTKVADIKQGTLKLLDLDSPLLVSSCRVLRRNINNEPCVPFMDIVKGFFVNKNNRLEIIKEVQANPKISHYKLVVNMPDGTSDTAALKTAGEFQIVNQALYEAALKTPLEEEAYAIGNRVINDDLIQELKQTYKNERWDHLVQFKGKTLKEALDARVFETT